MQYLYPTLSLSLSLLASLAAAGDIDANDLPSQCKQVCAPIVSLTASCDAKTHDDDTAELSCICKDSKAASSLSMCDACISKYSKDGRDNDANDLDQSCPFTTTSFDPTVTATETSAGTGTGTGETVSSAGGSMSTSTGIGRASETASSSRGSMSSSSSSSSSSTPSPSNSAGGISTPSVSLVVSLAAGFFASFLV